MSAVKVMEAPVEQRVARLEANIEHIGSDITDMKIDIRETRQRVDVLSESLAALRLSMERSFASLKIWGLLLYLALAASLLGVMARGFGWV